MERVVSRALLVLCLFVLAPLPCLAQFGDANLVATFEGAIVPPSPGTFAPVSGGATLKGKFLQIGVADVGRVGFSDLGLGVVVGFRFDPTGTGNFPNPQTANFDVIIPGCLCEGWGIRADTPGGAIFGTGYGAGGTPATVASFGTATVGTTLFARSVAMVGSLEITHVFSLGQFNRFVGVRATIRNTSTTNTITNIRYVRHVDFDIDAAGGGAYTSDRHNTLNELGHTDILRAVGTTTYLVAHGLGSKSPFTFGDSVQLATVLPDPDIYTASLDANDALGDNSESFRYNVGSLAPGASAPEIVYTYLVGSETAALPTVTIAATDAAAAETGPDNGVFTVSRTGPTTSPLTVIYTVGGSATSGSDFGALSGSVVIPVGSSTATIGVIPIDDPSPEPPETVVATLGSTPQYNVGTPGAATVTIADNDADLAATKTDGVTTVTAGGSTTYTITASNPGPSNAPGSTVADTFPGTLTCTWTCVGAGGGTCTAAGSGNISDTVNLPAGGSVTYTASCTISASATGTLANTTTVTAPGGVTDPNPGNNSATDTDTIGQQADLAITKTDGVTAVTAGGSLTYTIVASNAGPSNATGSTVTDTFPGTLTCTWTCAGVGGGTCVAAGSGSVSDTVNLPVGGSVTYTASCTVSAFAGGTLANTATVAAPGGVTDPDPANNSATDTDTIGSGQADLSMTKTDGVTSVTPGGSTTYTIVASNAGPSAANANTVQDTFPAGLTCTWTCVGAGGGTCTVAGSGNIGDTVNLPVGGSVTYTASCTISASATGTLANTATVFLCANSPNRIQGCENLTDPNPGNDSATDTDTEDLQADLSITKDDGVTTVTAGDSTTYTIIASNVGPSTVTGATVADTFPATLTCTWTCVGAVGGTCTVAGSGNINDTVNLPASASVTYTASCTVSPFASGTIVNTATVAFCAPQPEGGCTPVSDPNLGNNLATDTDTVGAQADLSITKTDGSGMATRGGSITYTIVGSNAGPSAATGATVTDNFPAALTACTWTCMGGGGGTCTAAGSGNIDDTVNLPVGGTVTYTATCTVSLTATDNITNTATIAPPAGVTDPTPSNGSATDSDVVGGPVVAIPTLSDAAMLLLIGLFAGLGVAMLRRLG